MSWINSRQFTISDRNGRHYVFRRNNAGNTEINIPRTITTKAQAVAWLKAHPNKVTNPTRRKGKRGAAGGLKRWEVMVNGKKMMRFVNKENKEYYVPAAPKSPNFFLDTLRAKGGKNAPWRFTCDLRKQLKVMKPLGKGRQGIVFFASRYSNSRYPFAIKVSPRDLRAASRKEEQPGDVEFKIQSAAFKAAPTGVVAVHQVIDCVDFVGPSAIDMTNVQNSREFDKSRQKVILMEYCAGGSLGSWIGKQTIDEGMIQNITAGIIKTLYKIHSAHPEFRHNDLHLENIFVSPRGFLIGDFGWARLKKMGTNPAVNTANGTRTAAQWGVGPKTDARYDYHLFLNEMRDWLVRHGYARRLPRAMAFLDKYIPAGYRGASDTHTTEWRLKYGDPCPGLPSLLRVARDPYISAKKITSPNLARARARLRKVTGARAPTPAKSVKTNSELRDMSAANFLKLSPATRARAKVLRVGAKAKGPVKLNATMRQNALPKPVNRRKPVPKAILKSGKFDKLINKIYKSQGGAANESFYNAWNRARSKAIHQVANRLAKNLAPFTPSPIKAKLPSPLSPLGPPPKPKAKPKLPSPLSPLGPPPKPKAKPKGTNHRLSPGSGRARIKSNNTGRWVYANLQSLDRLKSIAAAVGVNIKGLRSKANIARKIFT